MPGWLCTWKLQTRNLSLNVSWMSFVHPQQAPFQPFRGQPVIFLMVGVHATALVIRVGALPLCLRLFARSPIFSMQAHNGGLKAVNLCRESCSAPGVRGISLNGIEEAPAYM
jgi:hypothetical protein